MILEGIVTTINEDASVNVSPMGPMVDGAMQRILLRPFPTSRTCANLRRTRQGVLHVTDDVELLARAAVSQIGPLPKVIAADAIEGWILADACRWYAFVVRSIDDSEQRVRIEADVVDSGVLREFFGFNRAKHAVVEAAILATRTFLLPPEEIDAEFARLAPLVEKTGGESEQRAFAFLQEYVRQQQAGRPVRP